MYCGEDTATVTFIKSPLLTDLRDTISCDNNTIFYEGNAYEIGDTIPIRKQNLVGCDSIIYVMYNERVIPQIEISSSNDTICEGEVSNLMIVGAEAVIWGDGDTSISKAVSVGRFK